MKATNSFGGAMINWSIEPANPSTPIDCQVAPQIQGILSLMERAYMCRADREFRQLLQAFIEEVDIFLADKVIGETPLSGPTEEEMDGLERFMDSIAKKEGKK